MDEQWRCKDHGETCKAISYLEKEHDWIREKVDEGFTDRINEIKDARTSARIDNEKLEDYVKKCYVTKEEMKTMYILLIAIALDAIRRLFV